jgi:hypothetical protein
VDGLYSQEAIVEIRIVELAFIECGPQVPVLFRRAYTGILVEEPLQRYISPKIFREVLRPTPGLRMTPSNARELDSS